MEIDGTGWQRPSGCLKLQVLFRKRATNYRALLWKMTYEDKASYDSTPPCSKVLYLCLYFKVLYRQYAGVATISRLLKSIGLFCRI